MAGEPTLNSGDTGDWVTYLQQLLEHLGLGSGFTAGVFDELTTGVVRQAQQQYSLPVTGTCDDGLWAALTGLGQAADQSDVGLSDIAVSLEDELAAPDDEVLLAELDELPDHVQVA